MIYQFIFNPTFAIPRHVLFWSLIYLHNFIYYFTAIKTPPTFFLFIVITEIFVNAANTYLNVYFLLPRILKNENYKQLLLTILSFFVVGLLLYSIYALNPDFKTNIKVLPFVIFKSFYSSIITGSAIAIKLIKRWYINLLYSRSLEKEKTITELKYLRNQINPHFLFNSLNNIYVLQRKKAPEVVNIIQELKELLTFQVNKSSQSKIKLKEEIEYLKNYINLEKIRVNQLQVKFEIESASESHLNDLEIPPLMLVPLVENAFKHARQNDDEFFIHMLLKIDQHCEFSIINTVNNKHLNENPRGVGLKNLQQRLYLYYDDQYIFTQKNNGLVYTSYLSIPFLSQDE